MRRAGRRARGYCRGRAKRRQQSAKRRPGLPLPRCGGGGTGWGGGGGQASLGGEASQEVLEVLLLLVFGGLELLDVGLVLLDLGFLQVELLQVALVRLGR